MTNNETLVLNECNELSHRLLKELMVSYAPKGKFTATGDEMKIVSLGAVMAQCNSDAWKNRDKGFACILPYKSQSFNKRPFKFDGVIFIDLDRFNKVPELKGKENVIFDKFAELCNCLPNIICMKFSPSHNLHVFVYHPDIKDESHYNELSATYMCALAAVIRKVTGLDLRDYDGALDCHQKAYQKLNVNHSLVKWNRYIYEPNISDKDMKKLKVEYRQALTPLNNRRIEHESTTLDGTGDIVVNKDFYILGWNGYDARTVIAAAAYYHFNKDINETRDWLSANFKNADEIGRQLDNMIANDRIENKYQISVERFLFESSCDNKIRLQPGQYLSDVIDFETLTDKYYYFNSNTGSGKTEFVKNMTKKDDQKIIILQMNKALRDGKKQGIENITRENTRWTDIVSKDRIHTTVEGFINNCRNLDLSDYTVVIDESHLLQDYSSIDGKLKANREMLEMLPSAARCIFMSATPKSDIKLFPFTIMIFERIQQQDIIIKCHPLRYAGRGSKEAARYNYMINYIKKSTTPDCKSIIFSNKHQECWKKYGLTEIDYTWFHSINNTDPNVVSILADNKLLTDITLATNYLGVGVEIKGEKQIHIWFDINEGWDRDFITQSIGRPRDAEQIYLHFFYTEGKEKSEGRLSNEEIEIIENAFENLVVKKDDLLTVNLIAARMTGVYDPNFGLYNCRDQVKMLKVNQLINSRDHLDINDLDILRQLPYRKITINRNIECVQLDTDGKTRYNRNEDELQEELCSRSDRYLKELFSKSTYDEMLKEFSYNDKKNARKMLEQCKYIWNSGFDLRYAADFFSSMSKAFDVIRKMNNYCDVKAGKVSIESVSGGEKTEMEIREEFEMVEAVFTKEYLDYRIDQVLTDKVARSEDFKLDGLEIDILCMEIMGIGMDEECEEWMEERKMPFPFKGETYKECIKDFIEEKKRKKMNEGRREIISIRNIHTGEVKTFGSKTECMKFLKVSRESFYKFLKGQKINKVTGWELVNTAKANLGL